MPRELISTDHQDDMPALLPPPGTVVVNIVMIPTGDGDHEVSVRSSSDDVLRTFDAVHAAQGQIVKDVLELALAKTGNPRGPEIPT